MTESGSSWRTSALAGTPKDARTSEAAPMARRLHSESSRWIGSRERPVVGRTGEASPLSLLAPSDRVERVGTGASGPARRRHAVRRHVPVVRGRGQVGVVRLQTRKGGQVPSPLNLEEPAECKRVR